MKLYFREVRIKQGLSIRELSRRSRVSVGAISDIENYNIDMKLSTYCKLAKALKVDINNELLKN